VIAADDSPDHDPAMPMDRDTRRIVRTALVLVAAVMLLLAAGMVFWTEHLKSTSGQPVDYTTAVLGTVAYILIAVICFVAAWRLKPHDPA
jgi:uncharacterized membrane protein YidH (DUF202 family)